MCPETCSRIHCITFHAHKQGWLPAVPYIVSQALLEEGGKACFPPATRNFPGISIKDGHERCPRGHHSRFSLHLGWAPSGPCAFVWVKSCKITPALIFTHCSCLFSSFYLLTWTLEIRLVKRQWRLWVLCLLSLNHPATAPHLPCPAPNSWKTEGNSLEYVTFSPSNVKMSKRSSKGLLWCYKWETGVYFLFPLPSPSRTFITSNTAGKKSSQSSSWQQWKSPNLRT